MAVTQYTLEKALWTEADFEQMGWHDVHVHAMAFRPENFELYLDIDYIFSWVQAEAPQLYYSFWIAPATLVFENVHDLKFDLESLNGEMSFQDVKRSEPRTARNSAYINKQIEWLWLFEMNEGEISFRSVGYSQFTRRPPLLTRQQRLMFDERGGVSFERDYKTLPLA